MSAELLSARSAVVVAPHPDDEALGCGGLVAALAERGATLGFVFVTDGGASHPNSRLWPRPRLAALRASEAAASLAALGAGDRLRLHLGLADAGMPQAGPDWERAVERTAAILRDLRPDLVLAPWRRDPHRDHRDSHRLVRLALEASGQAPRLIEYAIWLAELGRADDWPTEGEVVRHAVDIAPWRHLKRAAVAAHRSQLGLVVTDDPDGFCLAADTVRRLTDGAETFYEATG